MKHPAKLLALGSACAGLIVLGFAAWQRPDEAPSPTEHVTLWTSGAITTAASPGSVFALPDAVTAPPQFPRIPDVAYLRRAFPHLRRVTVLGDGLDAADAAALGGVAVSWQPTAQPFDQPKFVAVSAPSTLAVGSRFPVQGRVRGVPAGAAVTLSMEGPDGTTQTSDLRGSESGGDGIPFSLESSRTVVPGGFEWRLRLGPAGESVVLGASVSAPALPRVLVLDANPGFELARLQRWLGDTGSLVTARTQVSAEHFRFAHVPGSVEDFSAIEAKLLARFDVVVTTEAALRELAPAESAILQTTICENALGVLVVGEAAAPPPAEFFAPWKIAAASAEASDSPLALVRLRLAGGASIDEPVSRLPGELSSLPLSRWLARESRGGAVAGALRRENGWVARSLITDTWRWLQGGHRDAYATFWSHLLSAVARPPEVGPGQWSLAAPAERREVNDAVLLKWHGPADQVPATVRVRTNLGASFRLPVNSDPQDPGHATALFWPATTGWHEVDGGSPDSVVFSFYVQPAGALPAARAAHRQMAMERQAAASAEPSRSSPLLPPGHWRPRMLELGAFALFLGSAAYLWIEQRRAFAAGK